MKALIITEHSHINLSPLEDRIPHPLLPLAGKPILMHALELLHRGSVREVEVVSPSAHRQLAATVDTGPLLGMDVRFVRDTRGIRGSDDHCLIVGLTPMLDTDWNEELNRLGDLKVHAQMPIRLTACAQPVALLLPPHTDIEVSCDWNDIHQTEAIQLPIGPARILATESFYSFHESSFDLLRGEFRYIKPAGREFASGHRVSPKARVKPRSKRPDYAFFGNSCRVDKTAALGGHVIIGDRAIVGKGARIQDSIILDQTYIGVNTEFSRAIVDRNLLIKVDTGVCLETADPVLFGAVA